MITKNNMNKDELIIRKIKDDDLDDMYRLLSDNRVMKYLEEPFSYEKTEMFIKNNGLIDNPLVYAVDYQNDFIGYVIYHEYDDESMEIGWVLLPEYWNRKFASSLTEMLIDKSFSMNKNVVIECSDDQDTTKRIAEKYGFIFKENKNGLDIYVKSFKN